MQICGHFVLNILQIKQFMYHGANAQNIIINSYETGNLKMKFQHSPESWDLNIMENL